MSWGQVLVVGGLTVAGVWLGTSSSANPLDPLLLGLMGFVLGCLLSLARVTA